MAEKNRPRIDDHAAEALTELVAITGKTKERAASDAIRQALSRVRGKRKQREE